MRRTILLLAVLLACSDTAGPNSAIVGDWEYDGIHYSGDVDNPYVRIGHVTMDASGGGHWNIAEWGAGPVMAADISRGVVTFTLVEQEERGTAEVHTGTLAGDSIVGTFEYDYGSGEAGTFVLRRQ